jgi:uncharacterized membrane protein YdfJ with MMPL/SSD domain
MSAWRPLVEFSIRRPRAVLVLALGLTVAFAAQLPKMRADTDPKNMLPITSPVRQYNDQVEGWFGLHADVIVLGIRRDDGIFAPDTLARIYRITEDILKLPGVVARDVIGNRSTDRPHPSSAEAAGCRLPLAAHCPGAPGPSARRALRCALECPAARGGRRVRLESLPHSDPIWVAVRE